MKKLLFILSTLILSSCSCLMSQIPPQVVYAETGCQAPIPDYKTQVTVTGGCYGFTLTQTPAVGTLLTITNKTANVVIKATGANGKSSQIQFTVTMLDTITPKITPIGLLVAYQIGQVNEIYDAGDKISESIESKLSNTFPYCNYLGSNIELNEKITGKTLVILSKNNNGQRNRIMAYTENIEASILLNNTK